MATNVEVESSVSGGGTPPPAASNGANPDPVESFSKREVNEIVDRRCAALTRERDEMASKLKERDEADLIKQGDLQKVIESLRGENSELKQLTEAAKSEISELSAWRSGQLAKYDAENAELEKAVGKDIVEGLGNIPSDQKNVILKRIASAIGQPKPVQIHGGAGKPETQPKTNRDGMTFSESFRNRILGGSRSE